MTDLVAAFEENIDGDYHRVVLGQPDSSPSRIVLSVAKARIRGPRILETYQIPAAISRDLTNKVSLAETRN
jgi:hypothetical protein